MPFHLATIREVHSNVNFTRNSDGGFGLSVEMVIP
jgi:hypothetical protein